jgi:type I restriction enzyme S subunit
MDMITDNIDIWTSAIKTRSSAGRGSSKKRDLYGIKKLRELILELAVRGKLVPQDSNDEPASVLLERIAAEKARLVKDKEIRRAKVTPETDMPPVNFSSPIGWSLPAVEELIVNSSDNVVDGPFGSKLKATEYVESGIPLLRIQNIGRAEFKNNGIQYLTENKAKELDRHNFISGDIVLNKLGEPTGKVCLVPDSIGKGIIVADIVRIRADETLHCKKYLVFAMNSPLVAKQFSGLAKGVTRQRVNLSQVRSIQVPLPPLAEQHRIVAKVDELMALCDQLEQQTEASIDAHATLVETLLTTLTNSPDATELEQNWTRLADHFDTLFTTQQSIDQLKQTVLQLAVMGKLVPQDPNDEPAAVLLEKIAAEKAQLIKEKKIKKQKPLVSFEGLDEMKYLVPDSWVWCRLKDIADIVRGGSPRPAGDPKFYDGTIPFLKVGDVTRKSGKFVEGYNATIKEAGLKKTRLIEERTVLLSNSGATLGIPAICDFAATFNDGIAAFVERSECIFDEFLYLYLANLSEWFLDIASRGQGQPNLNTDIVKATWFALPPLEEQHRIVTKVDQLMTLCDQLKARLQQAQQTQLYLADALVEQALGV